MPSAKTECTELSVGFGLLQCNPINASPDRVLQMWEGTLARDTFINYLSEYQSSVIYYRKFFSIGVNIACSHKTLAKTKVTRVSWEGPRQQARSVSLPKDIVVANVPISIKADNNTVNNTTAYQLFVSIPTATTHRTRTENWFIHTDVENYQRLYSFVRNSCRPDFPENVRDYHKQIKGTHKKELSTLLGELSSDQQSEFTRLYIEFCRHVAEISAERFNNSISQLSPSLKNGVFESVLRTFFRLSDTEYVLCGLDNNQPFSIGIPDLSSWRRNWKLTNIRACPNLSREQSVVDFLLTIENRNNRSISELKFHTEIRWTHRKFNGGPEGKLYKDFNWVSLPFVEVIGSPQIQRIELIGTGGFGHVYRAKYLDSGMDVALKEFIALGSDNDRDRFLREVRIQQDLEHPNILPILLSDLGTQNPWFISPLANCNLAELIPTIKENEHRISYIIKQILSALQYAHENNVIHRDIKPENILVFNDDHIKIGDFGLGKRLSSDTIGINLTRSSENSFGSINYIAPEQMESFRDANHLADIYSAGKTFFHMVTGECPRPFGDFSLNNVEEKYKIFIRKCTEDNPADRFQTTKDAFEFFLTIN